MKDRLHFEPREGSEFEYFAAGQPPVEACPQWPGRIEEIQATEPDCAAYRASKARLNAEAFGTPVQIVAKKAPRVPRDTEPAPLHVAAALAVFLLVSLALLAGSALHGASWLIGVLAAYADAFLNALVTWIGGVL